MPTEDEVSAYKRGRAAIRSLRKDRNFTLWLDYATSLDAAQHEAERLAGTNRPVGKAYNMHYDMIVMKREKLVEIGPDGKQVPDATTRKDCYALIANYERPVDTRRRKGIKAWRAEDLSINERLNLNHPGSVMRRWKKDTEPQADKDARTAAREMRADSRDPMLDLVADTEASLDAERRQSEHLRELLGRVLDVADLPDDLQTAIHDALGGAHDYATQDDTPQPKPAPDGLTWTGNDDDGWLGRAVGEAATYTVIDAARGFEAYRISSDANLGLPVSELTNRFGEPLTHMVRSRRRNIGPTAEAEDAKQYCEIAYAISQA